MPYNFFADGLTQRNLVSDFLRQKCNFRRKRPFYVLRPPCSF